MTIQERIQLGRKAVPIFKRGSEERIHFKQYEDEFPQSAEALNLKLALKGFRPTITNRYHYWIGSHIHEQQQQEVE